MGKPLAEISRFPPIYLAERKQGLDKDQEWEHFHNRLEGKEVTLFSEDTPMPYPGAFYPLRPEDIF